MAAAYSSRDVVEDFLRHKLLGRGLQLRSATRCRPTAAQRRHTASASTSSCQRAVTSHRGVTPADAETQDPCSAPPRLQAVLRSATDELEQRYAGELAAHVSLLLLRDGGGPERRRGLTAVTEELFEDGVNWGRIVAMMELGGVLCTEVVRRGGAWQLDDVAKWMEDSLESPRLREWMQENGGWDAFVELYGESRPAVRFWSLRTVFGLAVLGAAGITLGALISWR